jgi:hypothetical protein
MKPMQPPGRATDDGTGWSTGRYLASALVAWIDQLRDEAKARRERLACCPRGSANRPS